jgi:hypothetical protein
MAADAQAAPEDQKGYSTKHLIATAKDLRKRAEAMLLKNISADDGQEIRDLVHQSAQAISERDWKGHKTKNDTLSNLMFYLEDLTVTIARPACNKSSPLEGPGECPRCRCDLTPLKTITRKALLHLAQSAAAFKQGDGVEALKLAERSWNLRHSMGSARLAFLAAAASNNLAAAIHWQDCACQAELPSSS